MKTKHLIQDTLLYGASSVTSRIFMLAVIPILVVSLSVEEFGIVSLFQFYLGFGIILFLWGLDQALFRYLPESSSEEGRQRFSSAVLFLAGVAGLTGCLIFFNADGLSLILFKGSDTKIILWLWIVIVAESVTIINSAVFRAQKKAVIYFRNTTLKFAFLLLAVYLSLKILHLGVDGVFIAYLISNIVYMLFSLPVWFHYFKLTFSPEILGSMLRYGLPLMPAILLTSLLFFADHYLIQRMMDLKAVGLYAFGYKFGGVLYYLIGALNNAWYPRLFSMDKTALEVHYHRLLAGVAWISMAAFLVIDSVFRFFHPWFVPDAYTASIPIITLVGLAYIIHNIASFADCLFFYIKKAGYISIMVGTGLILNLALNWILIPRIGILGAALATLAAFLVYLILVLLFLRKLNIIPIHYGETGRLLAGFAVLYSASYLFTPDAFLLRFAQALAMILLFLTLSWFLSPNFRATANTILSHIKKRRNSK
jgi:O-antigen/teichoic acid export membrane protein